MKFHLKGYKTRYNEARQYLEEKYQGRVFDREDIERGWAAIDIQKMFDISSDDAADIAKFVMLRRGALKYEMS